MSDSLQPIYNFVDEIRNTRTRLENLLREYEATGDHDHGRGPIRIGGPCGYGDDCHVRRVRAALALLSEI